MVCVWPGFVPVGTLVAMETNAKAIGGKGGSSAVAPCMECLRLINSSGEQTEAHDALSLTARNQTVAHLALYKCGACGANLLQGRNEARSNWAYFI